MVRNTIYLSLCGGSIERVIIIMIIIIIHHLIPTASISTMQIKEA
jgi:hypothetical protein